MRILYTAEATVTGGREGRGRTSDGRLDLTFSIPTEMGGSGGSGTNPEQLFAAGFAACFEQALLVAGRRQRQPVEDAVVTARVGIGPKEGAVRGYGLDVELHIRLPKLERGVAEALVATADQVCPYSNATRGNIDVRLILEEPPLPGEVRATAYAPDAGEAAGPPVR
jgi:lipoyl-dependent peroxiredoxin